MRSEFLMTGFLRAWVSSSVLRTGLGLALGLATGVACNVVSVFTCLDDAECQAELDDMMAVCESNALCTFPDAACPSMKRWHDRAGDLGGKCFEESDLLGDTDSSAATAGSGSGSATEGSSGDPATTTGAEGSTTNPVEDTGDPDTSGDPPMTDDGGSSSGGMMTCDEQFGAAMGYMLCEELPESCRFNAVTNGGSCDDMCMMFGSTCVTAFNNDMGDCASQMAEAPCAETAMDQICVCDRG